MFTRSRPAARRSWATQAEGGAVGGDRQVGLGAVGRAAARASLADQHRQVGPHRRLAAGQADAVDVEALDEHPRQPLDLLEREQLLARQPLHPLLGHAVRAAEVAAVGDRDAQVAHGAPERVDEVGHGVRLGSLTGLTTRSNAAPVHHPMRRTSTSPPGVDAVAVGHEGEAVGGGRGGQLVAALGAGGAHVPAPVGAERGRACARGGACRRDGGAARSSATARTVGWSMAGWPIIWRSAGRASTSNDTSDDTGLPGRPNTGTTRVAGAERAEGERLGRLDGDLHPLHVGRCGRARP